VVRQVLADQRHGGLQIVALGAGDAHARPGWRPAP
jgi:hypothetical protein